MTLQVATTGIFSSRGRGTGSRVIVMMPMMLMILLLSCSTITCATVKGSPLDDGTSTPIPRFGMALDDSVPGPRPLSLTAHSLASGGYSTATLDHGIPMADILTKPDRQ